MIKYLSVNKMLEYELGSQSREWEQGIFIFDANAFKYRYSGAPKRAVVTNGVMEELLRHRDQFGEHNIEGLTRLLNPSVVAPFVSSEDKRLIHRVSLKSPKNALRIRGTGLGWVDTQQLAYALEQARGGEKTVLVSNDADIQNTLAELKKEIPETMKNVVGLSVSRYYLQNYSYLFRGLNRLARNLILYEVDKMYRAA